MKNRKMSESGEQLEKKNNTRSILQPRFIRRQLFQNKFRQTKTEEPTNGKFKTVDSSLQNQKSRASQFLNKSIENINPHSLFDGHKSKVIAVQRLNLQVSKPKFIANIFGYFGNVVQLIINKTMGYSLIEFQNQNQADNAFKKFE